MFGNAVVPLFCVRLALFLAVMTFSVSSPAASSPSEDGEDAFRQGRFAEAVLAWRAGVDSGDARSALLLGAAYDIGAGVAQDYRAAMQGYRMAAEGGVAAAALDVGIMYDAGRGVPRDPATAVSWYRRAADLGSGRAAFDLGLVLSSGDDGVPADRAGAVAAFRRAADLGVPEARNRLAALGVRPLAPTRAVVGAIAPGAVDLGALLVSARSNLAGGQVAVLRRAADAGDLAAAYDLGYCYERGVGVAADPAAAASWYSRAARAPDARLAELASRAMGRLGRRPG